MSVSSSRQLARRFNLHPLGEMLKLVVLGSGMMAIASILPAEVNPPELTYRQPLEQIKVRQPCVAQGLEVQLSRPSLGHDVQLIDPVADYGCSSNF